MTKKINQLVMGLTGLARHSLTDTVGRALFIIIKFNAVAREGDTSRARLKRMTSP